MEPVGSFVEQARALVPDMVALRRQLHRSPEVGLQLPKTQAAVLEALAGLDLEITVGVATTSVIAVLRGALSGPTVLLRGDMDALPVQEATGLSYASTNGAMHACGHDLHTVGLVGAARLLAARREELAGDVLFMFQPGEEGHGGATVMLAEGLLEATGNKPVAAYAVHVSPGPAGVFSTRPGPIMAGAAELYVRVNGAGGHGSLPTSACDPVPALAELVGALQTMVTRRFGVPEPVVLTVTQLAAGEAVNVIPDTASLGATIRTLSAEAMERMAAETELVAKNIAAAHRCSAEVEFRVSYPATVNDDRLAIESLAVLGELFGPDRVVEFASTAMASEDFSFVLNEVPGAFIFLSCSPPDLDPTTMAMNHSPRVVFDDAVLGDQAAALAQLAYSQLAATAP